MFSFYHEKRCSKCKKLKDRSEFYKNSRSKDGLKSYCKSCTRNFKSFKKVYEKTRRATKLWKLAHPEKIAQYRKSAKNSVKPATIIKAHFHRISKTYGITKEQYDQMLREQKGVCIICGNTNKSKIRLAVDHDHKTGKVRGLLCSRCNVALGLVGDDIIVLQEMISYLDKFIV